MRRWEKGSRFTVSTLAPAPPRLFPRHTAVKGVFTFSASLSHNNTLSSRWRKWVALHNTFRAPAHLCTPQCKDPRTVIWIQVSVYTTCPRCTAPGFVLQPRSIQFDVEQLAANKAIIKPCIVSRHVSIIRVSTWSWHIAHVLHRYLTLDCCCHFPVNFFFLFTRAKLIKINPSRDCSFTIFWCTKPLIKINDADKLSNSLKNARRRCAWQRQLLTCRGQ